MVTGTDVPGRVSLRQGGSAATTARWLARLGVRTQLLSSVGRDVPGRALVRALQEDGVVVRVRRVAGRRTGRIGVVLGSRGERTFVADRGAADLLAPDQLRATWFVRMDVVHLPAYSLIGDPLGRSGQEAARLGHAVGAVVSLDLASAVPLLSKGRDAALALVQEVAPDVVFATERELHALLGAGERAFDRAAALGPLVIVKRGWEGVTVLSRNLVPARFEVATRPIAAADTIGAGDAFDAGFLAEWLSATGPGRSEAVALRRAVLAGHRTAARQLTSSHPDIALG